MYENRENSVIYIDGGEWSCDGDVREKKKFSSVYEKSEITVIYVQLTQ